MGRDLRLIPPNSLQHVVDVVFQNRRLLRPSGKVNERFIGILGRAQKKYQMTICGVVVLSSHYHLLLRPRDGAHLAAFMGFLKTNIAKEIGKRLRDWHGHFFDGRYRSTTVSDEEKAQVAVLRYLLSHGPKENLVDKIFDWPGVHCGRALVEGKSMVGRWFDRTAESKARCRGGRTDENDFASTEVVVLSPLPCWQSLSSGAWRRAVRELIMEVDRASASIRRDQGKASLGVAEILAADPGSRPSSVEKSPHKRFHAVDKRVLRSMQELWRQVTVAFAVASKELRAGNRTVRFPEGTFPPSLPFVPFTHGSSPLRVASV